MSTETNVPRILSAFPIHLCKNLLLRVVGRNVNLLTIPGDRGWGVDTVGVSGTVPPAPQALLTVSGAEAPGCRDRGERGAAVHGAEVMLHVGTHVGVGGVEGGLSRASGMWGKPDQRDVGDNRAATQGRRPAETKERGQKAWPVAEGRLCGEPSRAAGAGTRHVVQILTHQPEHAGCKHSRAAAPACPPARLVLATEFSARAIGFAGPQTQWATQVCRAVTTASPVPAQGWTNGGDTKLC